MIRRSKIIYPLTLAVLLGVGSLLSFLQTCEKLPPLELEVSTDSFVIQSGGTYKLIGSIRSFGHKPVTQHGFCWADFNNPTIEDQVTQLGYIDKKGEFSSIISDLPLNTLIHFRAYVLTEEGTEYGESVSFSTPAPGLPLVTTTVVTNITMNAAQSGGTITNDGGSSITARGVCWSESSNPTILDAHTSDGTGMGTYSSSLSDLSPGTLYFVRAYATNNQGTTYGNEVNFTTNSVATPSVTTNPATFVNDTFAILNGNVTSDGGAPVTDRGFYYGTSQNPQTTGTQISEGNGIGVYSSPPSNNLTRGTTYYFVAYATNSAGTAYGNELSFTTTLSDITGYSGTLTDYDGNMYNWIGIGIQAWMAENLKVTHYADGTPIQLVENGSSWAALPDYNKAYCWYDNSIDNRDTYGCLYNWAAAMNGAASSDANPSGVQGVCPDGWHLPSDSEWKQLEMFLGMSQEVADELGFYRGTDEGGKLKETGTDHWISPNILATNEYGFTALPGGLRNYFGSFANVGEYGYWWSSSEGSSSLPFIRILSTHYADIGRYNDSASDKGSGFSVRCVKD